MGKFRSGPKTPLDLAVSEYWLDHKLRVYWNDGQGLFTFHDDYWLAGGATPCGVAVGKLNVDTKLDVVLALEAGAPCTPNGGGIAIFVGYGDGTFREPPYLFCVDPEHEPKPKSVKIGDMDQDGFRDIVTSNFNTHNISVLINSLEAIPGS